jgi:hypothetical protein
MTRLPSIKTLSEVFDCDSTGKQARKVLEMTRKQLLATDAGKARVSGCYGELPTCVIRMEVLNALEGGLHGVESIAMASGEYADYLNTGDTYAATVILWRGAYRVQSVGDFIERQERRGLRAL